MKSVELKSLAEMPGPKDEMKDDLALFQLKAHQNYGPFVKFKLNDKIVISTTDVDALRRCSTIFDKPKELYQFLEPLMGNLMFLPMKENKSLRHLTISQFSTPLVQKHFKQLIKELDEEIALWLSEGKISEGIISIQAKTKALAMRLIVTLVCGQDFKESAKLGISIHIALEELLKLQYDKNYTKREKLENVLDYINDTVQQFIKQRREKQPVHDLNEKVFLDEILKNYQDETAIQNITKEILMASYHTVASSIAWTLHAITAHPKVSQKVYQEIDAVFNEMPFNLENLSELKYLDQVIKESSRRYTVGPYTARQADKKLVIGGYHIPKGTTIFYPVWAVHMDPKYWPDPKKFDPERPKQSYNTTAFMPYGHGARNCPGMTIAQTIIKLVLARLILKISFNKAPKFEPEICENFVLISRNDILLRVSPRKKNSCASFTKNLLTYAVLPGSALMLLAGGSRLILVSCFALSSIGYYEYRKSNKHSSSNLQRFSIMQSSDKKFSQPSKIIEQPCFTY